MRGEKFSSLLWMGMGMREKLGKARIFGFGIFMGESDFMCGDHGGFFMGYKNFQKNSPSPAVFKKSSKNHLFAAFSLPFGRVVQPGPGGPFVLGRSRGKACVLLKGVTVGPVPKIILFNKN